MCSSGTALYRVVSIDEGQFLTSDVTNANFKIAWEKLIASKELTCAKTGTAFAALPKPQAVIVDVSRSAFRPHLTGKLTALYFLVFRRNPCCDHQGAERKNGEDL